MLMVIDDESEIFNLAFPFLSTVFLQPSNRLMYTAYVSRTASIWINAWLEDVIEDVSS